MAGPLISLWDSASWMAQPSVESMPAPAGGGNVRLTSSAWGVAIGQESQRDKGNLNVNNNKDGVAVSAMASCGVKVPKFAGNTDLEVSLMQFELLAASVGWSEGQKALQLAMCLVGDAVSCLLMLPPELRGSYKEIVAVLDRRFGKDKLREITLSMLGRRTRLPGESLRGLANDVECLTRRVYAYTPPAIQGELARDRFIMALSPPELRA